MKIELLAPAGNFESLVAAVESGADAVYFGGTKYSARASADNFDEDILAKAVRYAHIRNVKIYLTVNILISDDEINDALEYIEFLYNSDIDGIIVQDIGLLFLIKKFFPDMPVHCSTQMTIHNKDGVVILRNLGADRFVLAREMNIKEINNLVQDTGAEIEVFVHGALCVSYSGQCLMSSLIGGRSGNRGKCAQPCRKAYSIVDMDSNTAFDPLKKAYLLSTKDLNTIEQLDEIIKSGVKSLKIEGRMKRPEYVAIVVKHYKDALDQIRIQKNIDIDEDIHTELESAFNRGFTHGFLFNEKKSDIVNKLKPNNRGTFIGKVLWQKKSRTGISVEKGSMGKGDGIEIILGNGSSIGTTISSSDRNTDGALEINIDSKLTAGMLVYKTFDKTLNDKANKEYFYQNRRKVFLHLELLIRLGNKLHISVWDDESHNVELEGTYTVEKAEKAPITKDKVIAQLEKTGDTPYIFQDIKISMDDNIYIPMSALNEIRRLALKKMDEVLSYRNKRKNSQIVREDFRYDFQSEKYDNNIVIGASLWKYENLRPAIEAGIDYIYYGTQDRIREAVELCHKNNTDIFYFLPNIIKDAEKEKYIRIINENNIDGIVISNISQLSFANIKPGMKIIGNYSLNVFNKRSLDVYLGLGAHIVCPSIELTLKQIKSMAHCFSSTMELVVHGQLPLMTMEYCPLSSQSGCKGCTRQTSCGLRDDRGAIFPIYCNEHKTQLLNSHVLFMAEDMNKVIETGVKRLRIDFYKEKAQDIKEIVELYKNYNSKEKIKYDETIQRIKKSGHTKGHYFRGVD